MDLESLWVKSGPHPPKHTEEPCVRVSKVGISFGSLLWLQKKNLPQNNNGQLCRSPQFYKALSQPLFHLILARTLWSRQSGHYPCFTDDEMRTQRVNYPSQQPLPGKGRSCCVYRFQLTAQPRRTLINSALAQSTGLIRALLSAIARINISWN